MSSRYKATTTINHFHTIIVKSNQLQRVTTRAFHVLVTLIIGIFISPLAAVAVACINPHGMSNMLGTSYSVINTTTAANLVAMTAKAREELWVRRVVLGSDKLYQDNPFADGMLGKPGSGRPIIQLTETTKVAGNTVNVPTVAGLGGPGVAGEGNRTGAEQKLRIGNFQVQIGRFWFGVGFTAVARDETVVGGRLDEIINEGLKQQMAKKKSDDIMMKIINKSGTSGRNYLLPDGCNSRADLVSSSVMSTSLISRAGLQVTSNGGKPMKVGKDSSGSTFSNHLILGANIGLVPLDTEDAYLEARIKAGDRGPGNSIFTGQYDDWLGHVIYRWEHIDHGNYGPVGSPLVPRAFLGVAIVSGTTSTVVQGGGSAAAAAVTPAPLYFSYFSNSPWTFFNGETIAADVGTTRWLRIQNSDNSYGVFPYILNDGNQITISGAALSIGKGTETTSFAIGSLVQECNAAGTPYCRHLGLAQEAIAAGIGTINGSAADPQFGNRTEEHRNHDMDHAIGVEGVWGCNAVQRPDLVYPGFIVIETALPTPGAPIIT